MRATFPFLLTADEAEKRGIRLPVEPINHFRNALVNTVADAHRFMAMTGRKVGMIADTYHMNMEEEQSVASTILTTGGRPFSGRRGGNFFCERTLQNDAAPITMMLSPHCPARYAIAALSVPRIVCLYLDMRKQQSGTARRRSLE